MTPRNEWFAAIGVFAILVVGVAIALWWMVG